MTKLEYLSNIGKFFGDARPQTVELAGYRREFINWFNALTWIDKLPGTIDDTIQEALRRKTQYQILERGNIIDARWATTHVSGEEKEKEDKEESTWWEPPEPLWVRHSLSFGDDWKPGKYKVPGTQVPKPLGYHRAQPHEVTKPVLAFANYALKVVNPEKLPQSHVIGKRIIGLVENLPLVAQVEWHLDNHPPRPEQGLGPMEGDPFYHMGITTYIPDSNVGFGRLGTPVGVGWFGSKLVHTLTKPIGHFFSNGAKAAGHEIGHVTHALQNVEGKISKAIKKVPVIGGPIHSLLDVTFKLGMAPSNLVVSIAEGDKRIDHAVLDNLKEELKEFKEVAPYAEMVVSLVPGIGQGVGAAIAAGLALSEGQPISAVLKAGLIGACPGGPLIQAAVSIGVGTIQHIATGARLDLQSFAQTAEGAASTALGLPPEASNALVAGIALTGGIAKGNPLDKTLADAAVTALPISDGAKRSMTEASTLTLELAHGNTISVTQSARIAALAAGLPPTNPLRGNIETVIGHRISEAFPEAQSPKSEASVMQAALHSGLADTLMSMGADQCPQDVKNAIKSGTALGSAVIYQEHRAIGLAGAKGKMIESGIQQAKHHPLFREARKLAASKNATHGFDHANGLLQHQVGLFDVITARNSHDPIQKHGFDMAMAARIGAVGHPKPPTEDEPLSPAAHAGYAITHGMRSHHPKHKAALMETIQQSPSASVGAKVAVKEVADDNDTLWSRILKFFGIQPA